MNHCLPMEGDIITLALQNMLGSLQGEYFVLGWGLLVTSRFGSILAAHSVGVRIFRPLYCL